MSVEAEAGTSTHAVVANDAGASARERIAGGSGGSGSPAGRSGRASAARPNPAQALADARVRVKNQVLRNDRSSAFGVQEGTWVTLWPGHMGDRCPGDIGDIWALPALLVISPSPNTSQVDERVQAPAFRRQGSRGGRQKRRRGACRRALRFRSIRPRVHVRS